MNVALTCPDCNRCRVYNGRGSCTCGAYLIHHAGKTFYLDLSRRVWLMDGPTPVLMQRPVPA